MPPVDSRDKRPIKTILFVAHVAKVEARPNWGAKRHTTVLIGTLLLLLNAEASSVLSVGSIRESSEPTKSGAAM